MNFGAVRTLPLALPEVEEATSFGTPAFKVRKKLLARLREEGVLVVRIDLADKEFLIRPKPDIYFSTPHYEGYPAVLVNLGSATPYELDRLLTAAWRYVAPPRLLASLDPIGLKRMTKQVGRSKQHPNDPNTALGDNHRALLADGDKRPSEGGQIRGD